MALRTFVTKKSRSANGASEISEFVPALYILFLVTFLPLFNLGFLFVGAATQYLATNDFVSKASTQPDYGTSLNTMASEAYRFQSMGLANFLGMIPQGGFTGCGDDLYVVATNVASGAVTSSSADMPLTQAVDTTVNEYELAVKSTYSVSPIVNLSAVPLWDVPGLGQPVTLSFTASRPVEHPGGLLANNGSGQSTGNTVAKFPRIANSSATQAQANNVSWRTPNLFTLIQNAGEQVVAVNVFYVPANNNYTTLPSYPNYVNNWTPSGLSVTAGQEIWIDTQAVGTSTLTNGYSASSDANGVAGLFFSGGGSNQTSLYPVMPPTVTTLAMIGQVGNGPAVQNPNAFLVGNTLFNKQLTGSGPLSMMINLPPLWAAVHGQGGQMVRVIVTQ